jgi:hypothetical protein
VLLKKLPEGTNGKRYAVIIIEKIKKLYSLICFKTKIMQNIINPKPNNPNSVKISKIELWGCALHCI